MKTFGVFWSYLVSAARETIVWNSGAITTTHSTVCLAVWEAPRSSPKISHAHSIPFLPSAQPFRLRPNRYNPSQKDEIENQVKELLAQGMITSSSSPFASPVLLVKKKSGEWHLCVDYRRLNSMTVENRYPMPIMDELLDQLASAVWFTSLDLRASYHQILVEPADQYKTTFQTHNGHYE